jgi:hypothetical protein
MSRELKNAVKRLVEDLINVQTLVCTVVSVDKNADTCEVEPVNGEANLTDVRLKAIIEDPENPPLAICKIVVYPKVGSTVIVSIIEDNPNVAYVGIISEIDEILIIMGGAFKMHLKPDGNLEFNEGLLGGLVKIQELITKLNVLENRMGTHQHLYINAAAVVTPTTPDVATNPAITPTELSELEDTKIKH